MQVSAGVRRTIVGCDIHLFVEYEENGYLASLSAGEIDLPRDYRVFGAVAGLRGDKAPLFPPRGIPSISDAASRAYWFQIVENPQSDRFQSEVTLAEAERYVLEGRSVMWEQGAFQYVSDPDAHTASWLSYDELRAALAHHDIDPAILAAAYQALFAALEALKDLKPRVVFWFDN